MCGDLVKGSAVSNRSDERDNEVIAGVRKALAQPEPGDWGATLLDGWMESEGDAVRVVYEQVGDDRRLGFRFSVEDSLDAETTGTPADWDPLRFGCQVCREIREFRLVLEWESDGRECARHGQESCIGSGPQLGCPQPVLGLRRDVSACL
jgi:hypothetical protein